jgi:hypothetical protein
MSSQPDLKHSDITLRATPYEVGLLLNFGPRPDFRRKVFDNERKPTRTWVSGQTNSCQ